MAKRALTQAWVHRAKTPVAGQIEVFDAGWPGLVLAMSYGGAKSWRLYYRIGGKQRHATIGTYPAMTLIEARDAWRKARVDVAHGIDPHPKHAAALPASMAFESVIADWLKRDQGSKRSLYQTTRLVEHDLMPKWRGRRIDTIGKRDVLDLIDGINDRGAPVKSRNVYGALHRFFKWSVSREIIQAHPMAGLARPKAKKSRERVLTDAELVEVWRGAEGLGPFGTVVRMLILTGARKEEIGQLAWNEVHGDAIHLEGSRTKNGNAHIIPLSTPAKALLAAVPRVAGCDYLFTVDGKKTITGWSRAKAKLDAACGVQDWRIHDLRRSTATGMQKLKVPLPVTEAILGHTGGSRAGIVKVYQVHDYCDEKRGALEAWGAHVQDLLAGREPGKVLPMRGAR